MKKIILSLLIIFISLPAPAASAPKTADLEITVLYKEDKQPSAAAFIKIGNADIGWLVDTNGKHTIYNVSAGQEYTISEMGNKNITYIVSENDMQKQSDGSYLIKKTFYLEPDDNNTITESTISTCTTEELAKLNAKDGRFINNQCQPTKCIEPRYELLVISGSLKENPELYHAECVDQNGQECDENLDPYARGSVYEYDKKSNELNCVSASCIDGYTLDNKTKKCIPSECTPEQEANLKAAHATSWKLADDKKDCIPTKCECGYGYEDGKPVNGTCNTPKWSWDNDTPPEPSKIKCDIDNASEAYMDCRDDDKAYCRVYKCENGFTPYGNKCIQDACDPKEIPNALYVKRVGDDCIIQECEPGYNVDTASNTCVARNDLLSEEDSKERIKKLQENEDAVAENAQTWENKLLGTAGIGGAGAGGQMLASGIAQRVADEAAERDMTAYLATFRCKYGNKSVDSGGDEVQLPGANDKTYASLLSEYKTLAASLKLRKDALGMAPGIESDEILDGSTLYGRGNTGGADGTYLSLADALSGDKDAQNEWDEQKEKANALAIGGGVLAGGAIIGTAIGSAKVNKNAPKNKANEINQEYDAKRGTIVDDEAAQPAQGGGTNSESVNKSSSGNGGQANSDGGTDGESGDISSGDKNDGSTDENGTITSNNEEWPFTITMLDNDGSINIKINARGTFYYDCGDGKKQKLDVWDFGVTGEIKCENVAAKAEIKLGGLATKYYDDHDKSTIAFDDGDSRWKISGSLGAIFPTLNDGSQPVFNSTFYNCTKLSGEIPENLFDGISGPPAKYMFYATFDGCSGLTGSIPEKLFAGISGPPADWMFDQTFSDCSGLDGSIPENLFDGISGAPAKGMFWSTFNGCSGLTDSIPEKLFKGISGAPAERMFSYTFNGCSGLTDSIPEKLFKGINGAPAERMFLGTFSGCSGLTGSIPENLFAKISGKPAEDMFGYTFYGCSGLDGSIPEKLFAGIDGEPASFMFSATFSRCSGLDGSIPADLFKGISGPPAEFMFYDTFVGCSGLTGTIPEKLFAGINGQSAENMFESTFWGCSKLSGTVRPDFFGTIDPPIDDDYVKNEKIFHDTKVIFKE